ncbi:MAG: coproporphyrinogen-III oxidase family protein [Candidatus Aminicenantes bacterium]|nr:coproporphyrinogen-III oxidase family protein [Candidatus Aminicenantes bacterium]
MEKAGLYVHFPFCRAKCPYCHFASRSYDRGSALAWAAGVLKEAEAAAGLGLRFDTLYFGGGTPSLIDPDELVPLIDGLRERLRLEPLEFTLEANPSTRIGPGSFSGLSRAGVTRLSVGVQSFDDAVLGVLGREATAAEAERYVAQAADSSGFSLGLDLMAGAPGEAQAGLEKTLEAVSRLRPDHVSVYLLENVEGLPFEAILREHPVEDDAAADAFEFLARGLASLGLRRYEISNFARPGFECRHNLKYWRYEPFLGLGPSAASHIGAERWTNADRLEDWLAGLEAGCDPRREIVRLEPEASAREAMAAGLRLVEGVDLAALERRFGIDFAATTGAAIARLKEDGLLAGEGSRIWIPEERLLVSNAILARLI